MTKLIAKLIIKENFGYFELNSQRIINCKLTEFFNDKHYEVRIVGNE